MRPPKQNPTGKLHRHVAFALAGGLLWTAAPYASAGVQASQALHITAVVKRHAAIRLDTPQSLTITERDVAQGYVDVVSPVGVTVSSNVPQGYLLALQNHGGQVLGAVLHGLASPVVVGETGGSVARPAPKHGLWTETLALRVRFQLSPQARPGVHPWPLLVSMMTD